MKKIAFICTANIKHMTLISLYTDIFKQVEQEFDIIYIDKYHELEKYDGARKLYRYELTLNPEWKFPKKFLHYWGFRKYAIDVIEEEKYDFLIVWNEFTAFMFEDYLRKRFASRYCVNIRDENYNYVPFIQWRYKKVVEKSCFNTISSDRFRKVFPKGEYYFIHSYNIELLKDITPVLKKRNEEMPIRVMFIGRMSYPESMKRTIDALGNNEKFEFYIIGAGCEFFEPYVNEKKYKNIIIHGAFSPQDTSEFLENADIIYSLNKENDIHSDTLLPIKLYYAIGKHIPILTYKSSYTYEFAKKHNMEIGVKESDFPRIAEIIWNKYKELDQKKIDEGCEFAMDEIKESHRVLKKLINKYIIMI